MHLLSGPKDYSSLQTHKPALVSSVNTGISLSKSEVAEVWNWPLTSV